MAAQQFCLKWNNHTNNMLEIFNTLLSTEALVDVTLACDGLSLKAHKIVLSACSPFFQSLFLENPCQHPIVIMKDIPYKDLKAIVDFMYRGEVNVSQDQLSGLLRTAETLKVKGLADENRGVQQEVSTSQNSVVPPSTSTSTSQQRRADSPPLHAKRKKGRPRKRSLSDSNRSDDEMGPAKIKEPNSPEIEELSEDAILDEGRSDSMIRQRSSSSQRRIRSSVNTSFSSKSLTPSNAHIEEPPSGEEEFELEPSKLLEQTLTTDAASSVSNTALTSTMPVNFNLPSSSGIEISQIGSDSQALVPVAGTSDSSHLQGPDSPPDIKPTITTFDESQSDSMMYMDQSSLPGPSNYQDNSMMQGDEQPQVVKVWSLSENKEAVKASSFQELKGTGSQKLEWDASQVHVYRDDGTEIDDNEIFSSLPSGTGQHFCRPGERPGPEPGQMPTMQEVTNTQHKTISSSDSKDKNLVAVSSYYSCPTQKHPWPVVFEISFEKFSTELKTRALKGIPHMNWQARHELLNILAEDIARYTLNPDCQQRKQVAECLIKQYPSLRSGLGDGVSSWAQRIYDKMKDIRMKLDTTETKAKRHSRFNTNAVKVPHRGEVNWAPQSTSSTEAIENAERIMCAEAQKEEKDRNINKIEECLKETFDFRRSLFIQRPAIRLPDAIAKYPLLFTSHGLRVEFKALQNIDPQELLVKLVEYGHKIVEEANKKSQRMQYALEVNASSDLRQRRLRAAEARAAALELHRKHQPCDATQNAITAFLVLPSLLNDDPECVYKVIDQNIPIDEIAAYSYTPIAVFIGDPLETNEVYICAEGTVLSKIREPLNAIRDLFTMYYVCQIEYPENAKCTFLFMQAYLLKLHHSRKLPGKLLNFIDHL